MRLYLINKSRQNVRKIVRERGYSCFKTITLVIVCIFIVELFSFYCFLFCFVAWLCFSDISYANVPWYLRRFFFHSHQLFSFIIWLNKADSRHSDNCFHFSSLISSTYTGEPCPFYPPWLPSSGIPPVAKVCIFIFIWLLRNYEVQMQTFSISVKVKDNRIFCFPVEPL